MINVAVVGAGFCGLAVAWSFLQPDRAHTPKNVTIFGSQPIGISTSGIAAGLLHPFVGIYSKLNHLGFEGYHATEKLISIAEKQMDKPVAARTGICRIAQTVSQRSYFKKASELNPGHIKWLEAEEMSAYIPGKCDSPGIFINTGMTVYAPEYLQGLWLACQQKGAVFKHQQIHSLQELSDYDVIVVAMGADCTVLPELSHLRITRTKGQLLELNWPKDLPPLPTAINSQLYCIMSQENNHCIVGSTYEKVFNNTEPNLEIAANELLPKLNSLLPILEGAKISACRSGVRASTPNRQPLLTKVNEECWVISGMGSKGLLYHALYAEQLVQSIWTEMKGKG
ncbi:MAG: FAD-binding oxidoreductase [Parachlamydiaceae bacterium]|nr:FAD-binding oxidoreductase [Parachlamydiaceae bacterium]